MSSLGDWLDERTGCRNLRLKLLFEHIPGGAKWRYVWGSTLLFTFVLQVLTGLLLWTAYSPSAQTAWESVYFIQYQMQFGWFIRGLHHYTSQAMVVLVAVHLLQVVIAGAYRRPREINWWLGLMLMFITLGLALTGYLLPWDEKGFWATQVTTKIIGVTPILGPYLERLLVGGPSYGHHTLTRFFALHAGLLPMLFVLAVAAHVALFRRHGVTHPPRAEGTATFWPSQFLRDSIACLAVLVAVILLVLWGGPEKGFVSGPEAGAALQAPADPSQPYLAARPEWYFLFLFQFLKYFPGETEIIGAIVVPSLIIGLLLLFPFLGRSRLGHQVCLTLTLALLTSVTLLTWTAIQADRADPLYRNAVIRAQTKAERVITLAQDRGIPKAGALTLLRNDPMVQGPILFRNNCSACHRWNGHNGTGLPVLEIRNGRQLAATAGASDLAGFGTQDWIRDFLKDPADPRFFGYTKHKNGMMAMWSRGNIERMTDREIDAVAAFLASQAFPERPIPEDLITLGIEVFASGSRAGAQACSQCHNLQHSGIPPNSGMIPAPDLTGYGSEEWLLGMVRDSSEPRYYDGRNQMPKFAERLAPKQLRLLISWLRGQQ
ncbi:MAG: cytochrome b N-terminal domain-containing protein [Acidobacteriota bacterium]